MEIRDEAEVIKFRLRTEARLTIKELAARIGCHPSTISMVIARRRKSARIFEEIAKVLGEDPSTFMSTTTVSSKKTEASK